jgi:hypothetical protein
MSSGGEMSAGIRIDVEDCAKQGSGPKASGAQSLVLEFGLFRRSLLAFPLFFLFSSLLFRSRPLSTTINTIPHDTPMEQHPGMNDDNAINPQAPYFYSGDQDPGYGIGYNTYPAQMQHAGARSMFSLVANAVTRVDLIIVRLCF